MSRIRRFPRLQPRMLLVLIFLIVRDAGAISPQTERGAIVIRSDTVLTVHTNFGAFTPRERAERATAALQRLLAMQELDTARLVAVSDPEWTAIQYDTITIIALGEADAQLAGVERETIVQHTLSALRSSLADRDPSPGWRRILMDLLRALAIIGGTIGALLLMARIFPKFYERLGRLEGTFLRPVHVRGIELISSRGLLVGLLLIPQTIRLLLTLLLIYFSSSALVSMIPHAEAWGVEEILAGLAKTVFLTVIMITAVKSVRALDRAVRKNFDSWQRHRIESFRIQTIEVLSKERFTQIAYAMITAIRWGLVLGLLYLYLTVLFSFFTFTATWASTLFRYFTDPLGTVAGEVVMFLPKLFFIIVVIFLTRFVIKLVKTIFLEIQTGSITLSGFHSEWAIPTYKIVRFLIIAFAGIIIFPYLPGSDSDAFKGISVFLGILFSLGSAGAISNVMAGLVLTYMRPFRVGDRVKIGESSGDVVEKTLLITRVRTPKNVDITIPNAQVLNSHILNYSTIAQDPGLILHTAVTIGYDVPWRKVHQLLINAAHATQNTKKEPAPFVLQTSLDDWSVSYELNVYTPESRQMTRIYSELHQNIQDAFNEAGIEIMSPRYEAHRDGNMLTIPEEYRTRSSVQTAGGNPQRGGGTSSNV